MSEKGSFAYLFDNGLVLTQPLDKVKYLLPYFRQHGMVVSKVKSVDIKDSVKIKLRYFSTEVFCAKKDEVAIKKLFKTYNIKTK